MSTGPRIPRAVAITAAHVLHEEWSLGADAVWCGSLRRGLADVGDLDLVVPVDAADRLFTRIDATVERTGELFGSRRRTLVSAVRGHKPGFLTASYIMRLAAPHPAINLQVNRSTPSNHGWKVLMCTGPGPFGEHFLRCWKKTWSIPREQEASKEGHLRDAQGAVVPVPTEEDAFRLCGMAYVPPEGRDAYVARLGLDKEHLR